MAFCLFHVVLKFCHLSAFQRRDELVSLFDFVMALVAGFCIFALKCPLMLSHAVLKMRLDE